jgi:hypothetical protein
MTREPNKDAGFVPFIGEGQPDGEGSNDWFVTRWAELRMRFTRRWTERSHRRPTSAACSLKNYPLGFCQPESPNPNLTQKPHRQPFEPTRRRGVGFAT